MSENQLRKVRKNILEVLDKLEIQVVNDLEDNKMFFANIELAAADGMMMNVCLYVTIKEIPPVVTLEIEMEDEIGEGKIVQVMELVNLLNRQANVGHLYVYLPNKTVAFKDDIYLVNGRLNKSELESSINHLLANVAFYSLDIREITDFNRTLDETSKMHWANSSYLHKECRSD